MGQVHTFTHVLIGTWNRWAFIKSHNNISPNTSLNIHHILWTKQMLASIDMRLRLRSPTSSIGMRLRLRLRSPTPSIGMRSDRAVPAREARAACKCSPRRPHVHRYASAVPAREMGSNGHQGVVSGSNGHRGVVSDAGPKVMPEATFEFCDGGACMCSPRRPRPSFTAAAQGWLPSVSARGARHARRDGGGA